jgi:hypothetical protein
MQGIVDLVLKEYVQKSFNKHPALLSCGPYEITLYIPEEVGVSYSSSVTQRGTLAAPADHHSVLTGQSVARFLCCTGFCTPAFVLCSSWHCRHKVS